jgi:hypothetical protein
MTRLTLRVFAVFALVFAASCTRHSDPVTTDAGVPRIGSFLFDFAPDQVTDLAIARQDSRSGDRWDAAFRRVVTPSGRAEWEISAAPGGKPLRDRRADAAFINHLLDTLRTLEYTQEAPRGSLESFGLAPPRVALRWTTPAGTQEIAIGDSPNAGLGTYGRLGGKVMILKGATLEMLSYLENFDRLRQRVLLTQRSDDVDEFEAFSGKGSRPIFYAQRESRGWVDRRKRHQAHAADWLESLTHLRIQEFVDEDPVSGKILPRLKRAPEYRFVFKDREGHPVEMKAGRIDQRLWAWVSTRPEGLFQLYPEAERHLRPAR